MTATEVGAYIRGLREHFKLSALDVSERLHIRVRYVNAIEENKYDQMPGKVYARGYVHTYAEFLGLDADQVVTLCFGKEEEPAKPVFKQPSTARRQQTVTINWRGLGLAAVAGVFTLLIISLFTGGNDTTPIAEQQAPETAAVAPVPETMLETVRDSVMPTAQNLRCLNSTTWLGCFFAERATHTLQRLQSGAPVLLRKLDLSNAAEVDEEEVGNEDEKVTDVDAALNEPEPAAKPEKSEKREKPAREKTESHDKKKTPAKHDEKKPARKSEDAF